MTQSDTNLPPVPQPNVELVPMIYNPLIDQAARLMAQARIESYQEGIQILSNLHYFIEREYQSVIMPEGKVIDMRGVFNQALSTLLHRQALFQAILDTDEGSS